MLFMYVDAARRSLHQVETKKFGPKVHWIGLLIGPLKIQVGYDTVLTVTLVKGGGRAPPLPYVPWTFGSENGAPWPSTFPILPCPLTLDFSILESYHPWSGRKNPLIFPKIRKIPVQKRHFRRNPLIFPKIRKIAVQKRHFRRNWPLILDIFGPYHPWSGRTLDPWTFDHFGSRPAVVGSPPPLPYAPWLLKIFSFNKCGSSSTPFIWIQVQYLYWD